MSARTRTATGKGNGNAVGLRQVAARANVSIATASAVLNAPQANTRVSEATRARVLEAARELQYHPNALARALAAGRPTGTIGVVFGLERASLAVANPYVFTLLQGITAATAEACFNVMLFTEPWHDAERSAAPFRDRRADGVIVVAPTTDSDIVPSLTNLGIPLVATGTLAQTNLAPFVDVDNTAGARLAVAHLLSLGHTRIAHVMGDDNLRSAHERRHAFVATLEAGGIRVPSDYIQPGRYQAAEGYEGTLRLLALPNPPTAIFAANDSAAKGVLRAAREQGIRVPEQLSVVGFDGLPATHATDPPLTTVAQPLEAIGAEAARLLLRRIHGETVTTEPRLFAPTLLVRASTAPPPQS